MPSRSGMLAYRLVEMLKMTEAASNETASD